MANDDVSDFSRSMGIATSGLRALARGRNAHRTGEVADVVVGHGSLSLSLQ